MQILCLSENKKLRELYPDFLHIKEDKDLDSFENFIFIVDMAQGEKKVNEILLYLKDILTCKGVFVLSSKPNFVEGMALLSQGVKGYGNLYMQPSYMQQALDTIAKGDVWLYPQFVQMMIKSFSKNLHVNTDEIFNLLSPREKEIALLVKEGLSNKEIAAQLSITERTTKAHLSSIYEKLHVKDRVSLVIKISTKVQ